MSTILFPSTGVDEWQWHLARPHRHWKHAASAMALAQAWERPATNPWPPAVREALAAGGLDDLELLLALPEHETPLPGGHRASQTDLLVLARSPERGLVVVAVEGKVEEPFGDQTVEGWLSDASPGKRERLAYLLDLLGLPDDPATGVLRYQLLHRAAAALIEAKRFGAATAVLLVHSFSPGRSHFDAYAAFAAALGAAPASGTVEPAASPRRPLLVGWVSDEVPPKRSEQQLGPRFDRALTLARVLHEDQRRKGTTIPYLAHLLGVTSLVLEDGGNEDEAIAALLHDAVEDQGGPRTLARIEHLFGPDVARVVQACSDTDEVPKPPWRARKEAYVAHLATADPSTLRVSLADKLHNARAILFDLRTIGDDVWSRFNADRDEILWYYGALADGFVARDAGPMAAELAKTVMLLNQS